MGVITLASGRKVKLKEKESSVIPVKDKSTKASFVKADNMDRVSKYGVRADIGTKAALLTD